MRWAARIDCDRESRGTRGLPSGFESAVCWKIRIESTNKKKHMKFAVFFHMPWPEESDPSRIFAETLEQVQYAEELGFCSAWFAEHHFSRYSIENWRKIRTELPLSYDYLDENRAFVGDPDFCIAKIQDLRDQGIEYFGCNFAFGGMEHEKVIHSMELFAKEIMPRQSRASTGRDPAERDPNLVDLTTLNTNMLHSKTCSKH